MACVSADFVREYKHGLVVGTVKKIVGIEFGIIHFSARFRSSRNPPPAVSANTPRESAVKL